MKTISIKDLVDFKRRSERSKKNFVTNLKKEEEKSDSVSRMDYWSSGVSAISESFKENTLKPLFDKKEKLIGKYDSAIHEQSKIMYKKNIEIIDTYSEMNSKQWRPDKNITFEAVSTSNFVMNVEGIDIKMRPSVIFTFSLGDIKQVGGVWFVSQKEGFNKNELALFCDALYRYLKINYSEKYEINNTYCTAVDVLKGSEINYQDLLKANAGSILKSALVEMKSLISTQL